MSRRPSSARAHAHRRPLMVEQLEDRRVLADGMLDQSFGDSGLLFTPDVAFPEDSVLQSDGKLLVSGSIQQGSVTKFAVARFNRDGSLDPSFAGDGVLVDSYRTDGSRAVSNHIALRSDGKILLAGSGNGISVAQLNSDGTFDTSFSGDGRLSTGSNDNFNEILLQEDGKILLSGNRSVMRLNANGSFDRTFSGDGTAVAPISNHTMVLQSDGKILIAGQSRFQNEGVALIRYNANGSLDATFGNGGIVTLFPDEFRRGQTTVALQDDGKILVTADVDTADLDQELRLVRLNADGSIDMTFSEDGQLLLDDSFAADIDVQPDGQIVTALDNSFGGIVVSRFNPNGTFDTTFNNTGRKPIAAGGQSRTHVSLEIRPDGRLLVVGNSGSTIILAQLTGGDPPTGLAINDASVPENQRANTVVGNFVTTDPDPDERFTYALVAGDGSTDNLQFRITGDQLRTRAPLDHETRDSYSVRVQTTDTSGNRFAQTLVIQVEDVNDRAVIANAGPAATYHEGDGATAIFADSTTVSDVDSPDFAGGSLTLQLLQGLSPNDRLVIRNEGSAAGQIEVIGSSVTFGGTDIGSFTGGIGAEPLLVSFNASASPAAVQALVRALGFYNINGESLLEVPRKLLLTLNDGDGGNSPTKLVQHIVVTANNAPTLRGLPASVDYSLNAPSVRLAPLATVTDRDSPNYNGGQVRIGITSGSDAGNRITLGGVYSVDADNRVLREGLVIGTLNAGGGIGSTDFVVSLGVNASRSNVEGLLRALRFSTIASSNNADRVLAFTLTDDDGNVSDTQSMAVVFGAE